jgi:MerR family copper efflux transcriptional regulator
MARSLAIDRRTTHDESPLTTRAVCLAAGATRGMLRLYERDRLIEAPQRSAAGYRHYPPDTVARLLAIRALKEIGFSLREIALLLAERDHGALDPTRLRAMARDQVAAIDARIARLQLVRRYLKTVAEGDVQLIDDPECSFLADFLAAGGLEGNPGAPAPSRVKETLAW